MSGVRDVCVIGLGLIGGSLLRAATAAGRTAFGATASEMDADAASRQGFDVTADVAVALRRAAKQDAMVVLAVPLPAVEGVLRQVYEHASNCLLTDVTSVKGPVLDSVKRLAKWNKFVGGHPMAGSQESGWTATNPELFRGAAWVVCVEEDTDLQAWAEVAQLAIDVGAHVIPLPADSHDETVARISHLPHLFAAILATIGAQGGPLAMALAAGSFTDGTRVAQSRPDLVRAMTEGNRAALLPIVDEALGRLGATRGSLASTGGLAATINAGHEGAQLFQASKNVQRAGVRVSLTADDAKDGLIALGERGGRITAFDGDTAIGEVS
ncbi:prephenate dehydrogenase [Amycolatopsis xylanica]|uniref:Prephenate dehydrogenase n=1 Tax=Amycolatopsis xylanica TaxID=589385 RepID=A0A1H2ZHP3_9PSEU|nr:prephenate dehydrogenase [Amycolatopsis xylanica]SDX16993.1 prephenate dehydrogenase [Amycolatopsis xylanica]